MVVYYAGAGVAPKGICRKRKASFPTIEMHVETICAFEWMRRYEALRSVLPIMINFEGHLMRMAATVWSIPRRKNP